MIEIVQHINTICRREVMFRLETGSETLGEPELSTLRRCVERGFEREQLRGRLIALALRLH